MWQHYRSVGISVKVTVGFPYGRRLGYIMTNRPDGTLYIGATSDMARGAWEHHEGVADGFTRRYGLKRLATIQREKTMKLWPRLWKLRTISSVNPEWHELYDTLNA